MKVILNMIRLSGVKYTWETIYTALINNFMENNEVEIYADIETSDTDFIFDNYLESGTDIQRLLWEAVEKMKA